MNGEEEEVEGSSSCGEEGTPPPAVVLSAEVEVAEEYRGLKTHQDQQKEGKHDETKHVVHLARPGNTWQRGRDTEEEGTEGHGHREGQREIGRGKGR